MSTSHDEQHGQHHDVLDRDGGGRGDGSSGFVILRLSSDLPPGDSPDLRKHAQQLERGSLGELLDELGQPPTRRVITSLEPRKLLRLEKQAMDGRRRPLISPTRYWRVDARGLGQPLDELVKRFSKLEDVELAYAEMIVSDPSVSTTWNPLTGRQGYLDAAPEGIGARWVRTQPGGEGQGVGVVDLEQGWLLGDEDLDGKAPSLIFNVDRHGIGRYVGNHGAAVMGVIAADDNDLGIIGIAPSLRSLRAVSHFDGADALHVADAVMAALPSRTTRRRARGCRRARCARFSAIA